MRKRRRSARPFGKPLPAPPEISAGNNFRISQPKFIAFVISVGVKTPGTHKIFFFLQNFITSSFNPGITIKSAPELIASFAIFTETTEYDYDVLKRRLREMAFLTKGLRIILRDSRLGEELEVSNENEQISTLLERAAADQAEDTAEEKVDLNVELTLDDSSENAEKTKTGGQIGKSKTITLENGKKQSFQTKEKSLETLIFQGFSRIAETGFEPATFGL